MDVTQYFCSTTIELKFTVRSSRSCSDDRSIPLRNAGLLISDTFIWAASSLEPLNLLGPFECQTLGFSYLTNGSDHLYCERNYSSKIFLNYLRRVLQYYRITSKSVWFCANKLPRADFIIRRTERHFNFKTIIKIIMPWLYLIDVSSGLRMNE